MPVQRKTRSLLFAATLFTLTFLITPTISAHDDDAGSKATQNATGITNDSETPIGHAPSTELLILEYSQQGWSVVKLNGKIGLMNLDLSNLHPDVMSMNSQAFASIDYLEAMSHNANIINILTPGLSLSIYDYTPAGMSKIMVKGMVGYISSEFLTLPPKKVSTVRKASFHPMEEFLDGREVELLEWSDVQKLNLTDVPIRVIDVRTHREYDIICSSYYDHADVETITQEDTDIMFDIRDGIRSWDARPVWVTIDEHLIAASLHGMPHAGKTILGNGLNGHLCLHFKGSTTTSPSPEYKADLQNAVTEAWNTYLSTVKSIRMSRLLEQ